MAGSLYIVATPIGNAGDITERARRVLSEAGVVAAEDTRTAQKLFNIIGVKNKTVSNYKFNEARQVDFLLSALEAGKDVALVSDAGTPCVSDPGGVIVKAAAERGINAVAVCGASAVTAALSVCGFRFNSFSFYGFFTRTAGEIKKAVENARKNGTDAAVFFESPKRVKKTIAVLAAETPGARLCLCNDLTKMYERIYRGTPENVLKELNDNPSAEKGEYTLVIQFNETENIENNNVEPAADDLSREALIADHIVKNGGSLKEAVGALSVKYKGAATKNEFYEASLRLKSILSENGRGGHE